MDGRVGEEVTPAGAGSLPPSGIRRSGGPARAQPYVDGPGVFASCAGSWSLRLCDPPAR